jgi:hypothetical protein
MKKKRSTKHLTFGGLSGKITREYERKGYSKKRASAIGHATAGKIARRKGK